MLEARRIALHMLGDVLDRKQPFDLALDTDRDFLALSGRDKAFARMIMATTLRRLGQLDHVIAKASNHEETPKPPVLYNLLRMAAAQIAFMNVPDYAVVDTAVQLAEECGLSRQKGFVNAVLRRVSENRQDWIGKQDAARMNTPEWLMKLWIADYGLRTAAEIAQASLSEAPLDISLKDPHMMKHWAEELQAAILPTGSLRLASGGMVQKLPGFDDGMWWVQDAAASLPAQLFGDLTGRRVLDMCAAPGGKTAQLLTLGADVTALDRSTKRLRRLQENLRRLRLEDHISIEAADAASYHPAEKFDYILLDAPCTATGTIRRHPDVPHLKTLQDMQALCEVQKRLLENAADILASGGILIYCTCSLQKAEGEQQIESFLATRPDMRRLPVSTAEIGGMEALITAEGDIRVLPFHLAVHGGMDGFYVARLQKTQV
ncbi:MAG: 16S rRNA (cytosine(967)-C(5))-methyltransferase [Alphaproteobacteria bacterium CG_4_9_14_3_um_filter_47_13]|nr:MAG: 16S rRNA (cytosine(967)-C(5))-methyltransferase [Alphaproteobacteria bacterium CG_4_9_14_3_um_filter_47_13]